MRFSFFEVSGNLKYTKNKQMSPIATNTKNMECQWKNLAIYPPIIGANNGANIVIIIIIDIILANSSRTNKSRRIAPKTATDDAPKNPCRNLSI